MTQDFTSKKLTLLILITQSILVIWSAVSSIIAAGPASAAIVTYTLYAIYVLYCIISKDKVLIHLVLFATIAGFLELFTDHYLVDGINSLVYPGKEAMIWSSPAYMPLAWANVIIQLGYYGLLLNRLRGWGLSAIIMGLAGAFYIPLYEHLAKGAGWWWYYQNVPMVFNAPVYVIICEGLISLSLPFLLLKSEQKGYGFTSIMAVICGIWIYLSAVLSYMIGG
ncbi:DUF6989 domain-containing protein [Marinoscillum sp. MHG1-6]|uniref:DUF6989 domain-containing protein n=1 Tax=Marinoscillum sp. MHG1-6 TaxID=2959627 RepID=UPI0021583EB2|nr:hypothetical protein [Marinoscillum sp. MHG1-6]